MFQTLKQNAVGIFEESVAFSKLRIELASGWFCTNDYDLAGLASRLCGREVRVIVTDNGPCPCVMPKINLILMPRSLYQRMTRRQREAAVLHECYHIITGKLRGFAVEVAADAFAKAAGYGEDLIEALRISIEDRNFPKLTSIVERRAALLQQS